jgi:putative membrane protein
MAQLTDFLAAERTFLAWIRTGLALMGFGFVVARFGLFLQQIVAAEGAFSKQSTGLSLWLGTALIVAGVVVNLISTWNYVRLTRDLKEGKAESRGSMAQAIATGVFLAIVGIAMAMYLLSVHVSAS